MTVGDYLAFAARLRGVPAREVATRVADAESKTSLGDVHGDVIGELSHGYRQRVGVAQAIVHKPALLILDEPAAGLDPAQIVEMRGLLRGLRGEHTVLISSHFLLEISQTCDRLLVLHKGELIAQGSEADLAATMGHGAVTVTAEVRGPAADLAARLAALPSVSKVDARATADGTTVLDLTASSDVRAEVARLLVADGRDLLRLDRGATSLEGIFMSLTAAGEAKGGPQ
jgi:ABC-2 type transport system ATP-binding protein